MSHRSAATVMASLLMAVAIRHEAHANAPTPSELVKLNSRIANASGIRPLQGQAQGVDAVKAGRHPASLC